jgi:hypothetical protein
MLLLCSEENLKRLNTLLDSAQNCIYRAAFTRLIYENKDEDGDDYGWMSRTQKHSEFNTNI